jgi:hypothetical protein
MQIFPISSKNQNYIEHTKMPGKRAIKLANGKKTYWRFVLGCLVAFLMVFSYHSDLFNRVRPAFVSSKTQRNSSSRKVARTEKTEESDVLTGYFYKRTYAVNPYSTNFSIEKLTAYMIQDSPEKRVVITNNTKAGFSNRTYAFITSLYIAITKKAQHFVLWDEIDQYMQVKLPSVHINKPRLLSDSTYSVDESKIFTVPTFTKNTWKRDKNSYILEQKVANEYEIYKITSPSALFFELASNPDDYSLLSNLSLVPDTVLDEAVALSKNEFADNDLRIETLFQVGFSFAYTVLNEILIPKQDIQAAVDSFTQKHFKSNYVIGMHMRSIFLSQELNTASFVECVLQLHEHVTFAMKIPDEKILWFVATDDESLAQMIRNHYPNRVITAVGSIGDATENGGFYRRAILDSELLSRCDDLVITGGSTFGLLAAMRAGRMPVYYNPSSDSNKCPRMTFTEIPNRGGNLASI